MNFPSIDPVIFSLGPLQIRWYGLMYIIGFCAAYLLVKKQLKETHDTQFETHFENLNFFLIIGVILGARLGYVTFYNMPYYLKHPLEIFATWHGGMSFHGGCATIIIIGWIFCKRNKLNFWRIADYYIVTAPIGLFFGRIGNFINGELYGRVTDVPWGVIFPEGGPLPRHPSQLYEAALEGVVLFIILFLLRKKSYRKDNPWPHGTLLAFFLIGYGIFRIFVEFFREPDGQIGFLFSCITMGQLLSTVMILCGLVLFCCRRCSNKEMGRA